jgi:hypothetical protein
MRRTDGNMMGSPKLSSKKRFSRSSSCSDWIWKGRNVCTSIWNTWIYVDSIKIYYSFAT